MLDDRRIAPPPPGLAASVRARLDGKLKPPGSLGRLEDAALALALAQHDPAPVAEPAHLLIFAGDHGLVAEGVSAWPQAVTALMVNALTNHAAAARVLATAMGAQIVVADAGVAEPHGCDIPVAGIANGTRNALVEDAMTPDQAEAALAFGAEIADGALDAGARVLLLGEMGIGNTASATLLAHAITGIEIARLTGPGAGLDAAGVARKRAVLERASARRPGPLPPAEALAAFGGFEIAAMAGALIAGAEARAVVVIDGFIATAAALTAITARPEAAAYCIFAHRGAEPGHGLILDHLGAEPLLELGLRLGEGTGGLLALPLLRGAAAILNGMSSFTDMGLEAPL